MNDRDRDFAAFVTRSAARLFDAFVNETDGSGHKDFAPIFELIGRPGAVPEDDLRKHDVLLRRGEARLAHASVIVNPQLRRNDELRALGLRPESTRRGLFAHVVDYSYGPRAADPDLARLVVETSGHVPNGQLILRRRGHARFAEAETAAESAPTRVAHPHILVRANNP